MQLNFGARLPPLYQTNVSRRGGTTKSNTLGLCSDSENKFEAPQAPRDFRTEHLENAFIFAAKTPILNHEITCARVQLGICVNGTKKGNRGC